MGFKSRVLRKEVWSKKDYYLAARCGSSETSHPAMKRLSRLAGQVSSILDMGCGEGTRLNLLAKRAQKAVGIDISRKAIELAKKKYPKLDFRQGDLEELPFRNESFELVYCAFVFEHLESPETALKEGIRVLRKGGSLLIVAPNFGAPNRASPPFKGNRIIKLIRGFVLDFFPKSGLNWNKVEPIATSEKYEIDWDTTIEPYLGSLIKFLQDRGLLIEYFSSCWREELLSASFIQKFFRFLGSRFIYPFYLWGPHLLVEVRKEG
ncbi:hypothetical protein A2985_01940 [Candidatus Woesebacteria bacterium RIFCSPLOWO2_01_FULL_43_11]|uniref:Methyltransferase type 11 domain-containing protein n=1 Tax=Candidatus Woesebacteria bacterium RBG_16_42_24 TaxID=1802485 RepID=A0A1F7XKJ0_9BACT|nr:MAG: hypothetical protein A2V97_00830 [Candidatus Woesebacteria bacterium RBG_16_42_24]OGM67946.1 MAG: hypothetical protein A2985_01940 [Candidatus Woesebacteria bacterium RIFCSPLOWO2_01_FULL_43_11]